jgi:hypothetical protein
LMPTMSTQICTDPGPLTDTTLPVAEQEAMATSASICKNALRTGRSC